MDEWSEAADSAEMNIPLSLHFNSDDPYGSLIPVGESEAVIYKIQTTDPRYLELEEETGVVMFGAAEKFTHINFVEDNIRELLVKSKAFATYEEAFYKLALHEFGHFLGFHGHLSSIHSAVADHIYASVETCIDKETLEYYCVMNDYCGPNRHPTCKNDKIEE